MKTVHFFNAAKVFTLLFLCGTIASSCSDDDPKPVNEEEVITRVVLTFTGPGGLEDVYSYDIDGDAPEIVLEGGITYNTSIVFEDASGSTVDDVTQEVIAEADDHQVFYQINDASVTVESAVNDILDTNGNPLGIQTLWNTNGINNGSVTVYLIHEPTKKIGVVRDDFGGEDDVQLNFEITIAP